jgi:hypothetical protein
MTPHSRAQIALIPSAPAPLAYTSPRSTRISQASAKLRPMPLLGARVVADDRSPAVAMGAVGGAGLTVAAIHDSIMLAPDVEAAASILARTIGGERIGGRA